MTARTGGRTSRNTAPKTLLATAKLLERFATHSAATAKLAKASIWYARTHACVKTAAAAPAVSMSN
jgi:hypothetical protein